MLKQDPVLQSYVKYFKKSINKLTLELVKQPENTKLECEIYNLEKFVNEYEVKHA